MRKSLPILFILLFLLSGCTNVAKSPSQTGDYMTITTTGYNNGKDSSTGMTSQILCYDTESKELSNIFEFATTAQYSLGYYNREDSSVYYTSRVYNSVSDYGDQIFCFNPQTGKSVQLTDNFFAVNYIIPYENRLYFVAELKESRVTKLGYISMDNRSITYWKDDGDTLVEGITLDASLDKLFVIAYSLSERTQNVLEQKNGDFRIPKHSVYIVDSDLSKSEKIFEENWWIRTVMTNDVLGSIDIICDKQYNTPNIPSTIITYNLEEQVSSTNTWDAPRLQGKDPNYSSDGNSIFGISEVDGKRGIVRYDLLSHGLELCIDTPESCFINNMYIVKQPTT